MVNIGGHFEGELFCRLAHAVRKEVVKVGATGKQREGGAIDAWEVPKKSEEKISYAGETERDRRRKWRGIRAVLADDWQEREARI